MNLLALDASTEACTVGIKTSDGQIFEAFEIAPRRHTELIPKMLDSVLLESGLNKSQLDGCIVGIGPGAFTGIRIGIATIQGIAIGLNIPCYAVSSLHAIAQQSVIAQQITSTRLMASIDARMQEVYCAEYSVDAAGASKLMGAELLIANDGFNLSNDCSIIVGTGVDCVKERLQERSDLIQINECYPTASSLFQIFHQQALIAMAPEQLQASYIRNNVTYQTKAKI